MKIKTNRAQVEKILKEVKTRREKQKKSPPVTAYPVISSHSATIQLGKLKFSREEIVSISQFRARTAYETAYGDYYGYPTIHYPTKIQYDNIEVELLLSSNKCMKLFRLFRKMKPISISIHSQKGEMVTKAQAEGRLYSVGESEIGSMHPKRKVSFSFQPNLITIL